MNLIQTLNQLRKDIQAWVNNNLRIIMQKLTDHNRSDQAHQDIRDSIISDYNDLTNAPNIQEDLSGNVLYADESGNIIAKVNDQGFETTKITTKTLTLNGETLDQSKLATKDYVLEQTKSFITEDQLTERTNSFVTADYVSDQTKSFITADYVTEQTKSFITENQFNEQIKPFATKDYVNEEIAANNKNNFNTIFLELTYDEVDVDGNPLKDYYLLMNSELIYTGLTYQKKKLTEAITEITFYCTVANPTDINDLILNNGPYPTILSVQEAQLDSYNTTIEFTKNILTVTSNADSDTVILDLYLKYPNGTAVDLSNFTLEIKFGKEE